MSSTPEPDKGLSEAVERLTRMIGPVWEREPQTSTDIRTILAAVRAQAPAAPDATGSDNLDGDEAVADSGVGEGPVAWRYRFVVNTAGDEWSDWVYVEEESDVIPTFTKQVVQPLYAHPSDQARKLLGEMVAGWDMVEPEVNALFVKHQARTGLHYDGPPDFAIALNAARAFLSSIGPDREAEGG